MRIFTLFCSLLVAVCASGADVQFAQKPSANKDGGKSSVKFAVSSPTDVEVAVLNGKKEVVRHLAAGLLGGKNPPPEPLKAGLAQVLVWDGNDDFGKKADGGPFSFRVRIGTNVKFGRTIGGDPYVFGGVKGLAVDEKGTVFLFGVQGATNQNLKVIRAFDSDGHYLRTVLPFPADVPPNGMKDVAAWDDSAKTFRPRQIKNLYPEFYQLGGEKWVDESLTLISAVAGKLLLADPYCVYCLDDHGGVPGATFVTQGLWEKSGQPNSGNGPTYFGASRDGKYLYLSGPFSTNTRYGHVADPNYPPGQIYRMEIGKGGMKPFAKIDVKGHFDNENCFWIDPALKPEVANGFTIQHGPIHQVTTDNDGNVLVADRDHQCISIFSPEGNPIGALPVPNPDLVAVHPRTGEVYVMSKEIVGYWKYAKKLSKFASWKKPAVVATYDFGNSGHWPQMAIAVDDKKRTILWFSGVPGLMSLEDKGTQLVPVTNAFGAKAGAQDFFARIAADPAREEIYVNNGVSGTWRYNGATGEGAQLVTPDGKAFSSCDLSVGYDGLLFVRGGDGFSGPFLRVNHDLSPAPYKESGSNVLSPYIYGRMGYGFAEHGIGVGPDGSAYIACMTKWVSQSVLGFGPNGKHLPGEYAKKNFTENIYKGGLPREITSAIIGYQPWASGGIRVDLAGNFYVGVLATPKDTVTPKYFENNQAYKVSTGCIVKFPRQGGFFANSGDDEAADRQQRTPNSTGIELDRNQFAEGALHAYPGYGPFSHGGEFGANSCCTCRSPRFDLDRYGRLFIPNAISNSVAVVDNAGNTLYEFGAYGNFDSQYVPVDAKDKKPLIATPEIPLGWPVGAAATEKAVYVCDLYNRRVVRADYTYAQEATCEVK